MKEVSPVKVFEASVVVAASRHDAFVLWTQPEEMRRYWSMFDEVQQIDPKRYAFRVHRDGQEFEILAEVMLEIPGRRIAWRTTSGPESSGVVCFESEPDSKTRITVKLRYTPDEAWHRPELVEERTRAGLEGFRERVEVANASKAKQGA
jgi:uncharacterized membrane protein